MQFWKYAVLFEEYKHFHNILVEKMIYKTEDELEDTVEKEVVCF